MEFESAVRGAVRSPADFRTRRRRGCFRARSGSRDERRGSRNGESANSWRCCAHSPLPPPSKLGPSLGRGTGRAANSTESGGEKKEQHIFAKLKAPISGNDAAAAAAAANQQHTQTAPFHAHLLTNTNTLAREIQWSALAAAAKFQIEACPNTVS